MCNSQLDHICFPITFAMCEEADRYCSSAPVGGQREENNCCGPRGEPCCIECYYCLAPCAMVVDVLCFPCNMYSWCLYCQRDKQVDENGGKKRISASI